MVDYKYASWVVDEYLDWANDHQKDIDNITIHDKKPEPLFKYQTMHEFLIREDSKPKLKTLRSISEKCLNPESYNLKPLDIASHLMNQIEWPSRNYGAARKKEVSSSIDQFKKATNRLFNSVDNIYQDDSFNLIKNASSWHLNRAGSETKDENVRELIIALLKFSKKSTHQVLLEFADHIESLGTGDPYYLVNNKEPTESQLRVRRATYAVINTIGLSATKELTGLAPLITHIVDLTFTDKDPLCPRDVARQITTTIKTYESLR